MAGVAGKNGQCGIVVPIFGLVRSALFIYSYTHVVYTVRYCHIQFYVRVPVICFFFV